jgi:ribonuclease T2
MNTKKPSAPLALAWSLLLCFNASAAWARHHQRADTAGDAVSGQFDYYLLSLSWSPSYCLTHENDLAQCGSKGYGFVLHGLWPQYQNGSYPQDCRTDSQLTEEARRIGESLYPSPKLVNHEWIRHGSCSGLDAVNYFRTADRAAAAVRVPAALQTPRKPLTLTAAQVNSAFHAANSRMPADGMVVTCHGPELAEIHICLSRSLEQVSCGRGVRSSCSADPLQIPASR